MGPPDASSAQCYRPATSSLRRRSGAVSLLDGSLAPGRRAHSQASSRASELGSRLSTQTHRSYPYRRFTASGSTMGMQAGRTQCFGRTRFVRDAYTGSKHPLPTNYPASVWAHITAVDAKSMKTSRAGLRTRHGAFTTRLNRPFALKYDSLHGAPCPGRPVFPNLHAT